VEGPAPIVYAIRSIVTEEKAVLPAIEFGSIIEIRGHCIYCLERPCVLRQYEVTFVHDGCAISSCAKCECEITLHVDWFSKSYCDYIAETIEAIHYCAGNSYGRRTTNDEVATCGVYRTAIDSLRKINF